MHKGVSVHPVEMSELCSTKDSWLLECCHSAWMLVAVGNQTEKRLLTPARSGPYHSMAARVTCLFPCKHWQALQTTGQDPHTCCRAAEPDGQTRLVADLPSIRTGG